MSKTKTKTVAKIDAAETNAKIAGAAPKAVSAAPLSLVPSVTLALNLIDPYDDNPRQTYDKDKFDGLKSSILEKGLIQNIVVRPVGDRFQVYVGSSRFKAISELHADRKLAADYPVPVTIRPATDEEAFKAAAIENITRQDMNPLDECLALQRLTGDRHLNIKAIARETGLKERAIEDRLAVNGLPDPAKELIKESRRTIAWGAMFATASPDNQKHILEEIRRQPTSYNSVDQIRQVIQRGRILLKHALFDTTTGAFDIQGDLVEQDAAFFTKPLQFWEAQEAAVILKREELEQEGHDKVDIYRNQPFPQWLYTETDSAHGAIAAIVVSADGLVTIHRNQMLIIDQTRQIDQASKIFDDDVADVHEDTITNAVPSGKNAAATLATVRRQAAAIAVAKNQKLAKAIVVAQMLGDGRMFRTPQSPLTTGHPSILLANETIDRIKSELPDGDMVVMLSGLTDQALDEVFAYVVAVNLPVAGDKMVPFAPTALPKAVLEAAGASIRQHWTPDEAFFNDLSLAELRGLGRELLDESDALAIETSKKADAARLLLSRFEAAQRQDGSLDPEREFSLATWTPSYL
jgi:ParB family transcriptional regulator, chromosome partitioning protein